MERMCCFFRSKSLAFGSGPWSVSPAVWFPEGVKEMLLFSRPDVRRRQRKANAPPAPRGISSPWPVCVSGWCRSHGLHPNPDSSLARQGLTDCPLPPVCRFLLMPCAPEDTHGASTRRKGDLNPQPNAVHLRKETAFG